ncbi:hypothetical protein ARMGADRAFT_1072435 [Armillaria gallica]|uniref:Uncharacterized protein n=1 Tax=Armillaria gallica TaxID=47427 RepID=A0A2H3EU30_ARMGA|nr:hypothetical protein ARMGADRAFT_1072435 [Armillaria gallica]
MVQRGISPGPSHSNLKAESLPDRTEDRSPLQSFSWVVLAADVDCGKEHFEVNSVNAAAGVHAISRKDVLMIPTEELVHLFNYCLQNNEIPYAWLLSLLAAVLKKGPERDLTMPENYCIIGDEPVYSCGQKTQDL